MPAAADLLRLVTSLPSKSWLEVEGEGELLSKSWLVGRLEELEGLV